MIYIQEICMLFHSYPLPLTTAMSTGDDVQSSCGSTKQCPL